MSATGSRKPVNSTPCFDCPAGGDQWSAVESEDPLYAISGATLPRSSLMIVPKQDVVPKIATSVQLMISN